MIMRTAASVTLVLVLLALAGCQTSAPRTASPAALVLGSSIETAIPVNSIRQEYDWIAANRPGWKAELQTLVVDGNAPYDVITITKGNQSEDIYFDISAFFGKDDALFGLF
jgi:hypothetical protein